MEKVSVFQTENRDQAEMRAKRRRPQRKRMRTCAPPLRTAGPATIRKSSSRWSADRLWGEDLRKEGGAWQMVSC